MIRSGRSGFLKNRKRDDKKVIIKIPSEIRYIRMISSDILESLAPYRVSENRLFDIRLCVEEALRNAIVHGNRSEKKLPVSVSYWVEDHSLNIEIEDTGPGFDRGRVPDPTKGDNIKKGSGRGIYLIENLMDKAEFNSAGNRIRMVKRLK